MSKMYITVRTQKEGLHCWTSAPEEVYFLRYVHRHLFHIEAEILVFRSDRELEFFMVQQELNRMVDEIFSKNDYNLSCEMIAESLQAMLKARYVRRVNVRVSEDGENGVYLVDE